MKKLLKHFLQSILTPEQFTVFRNNIWGPVQLLLLWMHWHLTGITGRKKVLIYVGINHGWGLRGFLHNYDRVYGFEANPQLAKAVARQFTMFPHVHIVHAAVSDHDGEIDFHVNEIDVMSSLSQLSPEQNIHFNANKKQQATKVPTVSLVTFCENNSINFIDDYVSDIQGYDLHVLKTMRQFIEEKKNRNNPM